MVNERDTKRFAASSWIVGLAVALALVLGFACPAYADEGAAVTDNPAAAAQGEAVVADASTAVLSGVSADEGPAIPPGDSADGRVESSIDASIDENAAQPYENVDQPSEDAVQSNEDALQLYGDVQPYGDAVQSSEAAEQPSDSAIQPSEDADQSRDGARPFEDAAQLSEAAVQPHDDAIQPSDDAIQPSDDAIQPSEDAIQPPEDAAQPSGDAAPSSKGASKASQDAAVAPAPVSDDGPDVRANDTGAKERADASIASLPKGDTANADDPSVAMGAKEASPFDAEPAADGAGGTADSSHIENTAQPTSVNEPVEVSEPAITSKATGIDEHAGAAETTDTTNAGDTIDAAKGSELAETADTIAASEAASASEMTTESDSAAAGETAAASDSAKASKSAKTSDSSKATQGEAESVVVEAPGARIDAPALPGSPVAEPCAYEQAASEAQAQAAPEPEEQPAEIASRTLVRRAGTSNPVSPALVEASPIRVDGPLPSSQFAVLSDYAMPETSGGFSFSNSVQNRAGALLYHKARCRSP